MISSDVFQVPRAFSCHAGHLSHTSQEQHPVWAASGSSLKQIIEIYDYQAKARESLMEFRQTLDASSVTSGPKRFQSSIAFQSAAIRIHYQLQTGRHIQKNPGQYQSNAGIVMRILRLFSLSDKS